MADDSTHVFDAGVADYSDRREIPAEQSGVSSPDDEALPVAAEFTNAEIRLVRATPAALGEQLTLEFAAPYTTPTPIYSATLGIGSWDDWVPQLDTSDPPTFGFPDLQLGAGIMATGDQGFEASTRTWPNDRLQMDLEFAEYGSEGRMNDYTGPVGSFRVKLTLPTEIPGYEPGDRLAFQLIVQADQPV